MRRISRIAAVVAMVSAGVGWTSPSVTATPAVAVREQVPVPSYSQAQLATLQSQVDRHLADYDGGKQIGINQIEYQDGGMVLTLPLPGEKAARALTEPVRAQADPDCPSGSSCLWDDTGYEGVRLARSKCGPVTLSAPFNASVGSLHNNNYSQTVLFNSAGHFLNANQYPTRINDTGVGARWFVHHWEACP